MSFTKDELQSFTTILDQKLSQQRRELERSFDTRLQISLRAFERQLAIAKRDIVHHLSQLLAEQYRNLKEALSKKIDEYSTTPTTTPDFSEMELHTEIPLDDLAEAINQALNERFTLLQAALTQSIAETEHSSINETAQDAVSSSSLSSIHDVFESVERLEHLIESMQVAMTSNHALLTNRVYHHQQLPLERAHQSSADTTQGEETVKSSLPLPRYN